MKFEDKDKTIILLSSLPSSLWTFCWYITVWQTIFENAWCQKSLKFKRKLKETWDKRWWGTDIKRKIRKNNGWKGKKNRKSKSKNKNLKFFQCHKKWYFKKTTLKWRTSLRSQKSKLVILLLLLMTKKNDMTQLEFLWALVTKLKVNGLLNLVKFTISALI